jgi:H+/Cl- antiporter ClcA
MNAMRDATLGTGSPWDDIAMCVVLSIVYGALGALLLRVFLRAARRRRTLALS